MLSALIRFVFLVAYLVVAVSAVPATLLGNVCSRSSGFPFAFRCLSPIKAIEARALEARAPIIKFHVCTSINYFGDCYYLATEPLTVAGSSTSCVNFKAGVASKIQSIRVLDTWRYAVDIYE
jgi:hypothetical protein